MTHHNRSLRCLLVAGMVIAGCTENDVTRVCYPNQNRPCTCEGFEGVQVCAANGEGWGACGDCGADDSLPDGKAAGRDTGTGEPLGECEYVSCEGAACEGASCCEGAACSDWVFPTENGFIEGYCYPLCDESGGDPCKCGDTCLVLDEALGLCVKTGVFRMDVVAPVSAVGNAIVADAEDLDFELSLGDEPLPMDRFDFYWYEPETSGAQQQLVILGQGRTGFTTSWLLRIAIPQTTYDRGPGEYTNENGRTYYAELYHGTLDFEGNIEALWREAVLDADDSTLTLHETCAPCVPSDSGDGPDGGVPDGGVPDGGADTDRGIGRCEACHFSFDFFWYALRAQVALSD